MDSNSVKQAIIKQILLESNTNNARQLIEKINENCFEKCIPKPGTSVSSGEQTCVTQCMEKYMAAWNQVNASYLRRIQQEVGNSGL
ncbi:putative mitochondrial import inner membrane translocase subunit tim13 protein [Phaeoacremonium minimum UCRPA7]|uniref:Mitochondrial import inner membrane translocase subunit n=1 Tax=Phaeoacremonium minimum (strain UCR-PA7) TaxID=1286976 RepID=R8BXS2_PHAM7|nr:putative mitochondrial import inner membrane translocase subunit tim13 protein [Phaeoacremonium minimum UCRPA7]EOO04125.1 putative mitochondrial import inner membrane translocase subunit tim13 protein [Phaeoacremonium minimum UCRPA7]